MQAHAGRTPREEEEPWMKDLDAPPSRELSGYSRDGNAVYGESGNVGVYAGNFSSGTKAYLGARCCAGDFYGDVYVHGNMKVEGQKNFVIDHPIAQRTNTCITPLSSLRK